jgi:hypothetical protein
MSENATWAWNSKDSCSNESISNAGLGSINEVARDYLIAEAPLPAYLEQFPRPPDIPVYCQYCNNVFQKCFHLGDHCVRVHCKFDTGMYTFPCPCNHCLKSFATLKEAIEHKNYIWNLIAFRREVAEKVKAENQLKLCEGDHDINFEGGDDYGGGGDGDTVQVTFQTVKIKANRSTQTMDPDAEAEFGLHEVLRLYQDCDCIRCDATFVSEHQYWVHHDEKHADQPMTAEEQVCG